jgi:hypothetical protein
MKTLADASELRPRLSRGRKRRRDELHHQGDVPARRRKTSEAAVKKAREMSRAGCYNVHITTPEGRDYHSSEFGEIPRTPVVAARRRLSHHV